MGIEITIFVSILSHHIVLLLRSDITHFQLEHVEGIAGYLKFINVAECLFLRRYDGERSIHAILIGTLLRSQTDYCSTLGFHVLQVEMKRGSLCVGVHDLEIQDTIFLVKLHRLIDALLGWQTKRMDVYSIKSASHVVAVHLDFHVIPLSGLDGT